MKIFNQSYFDQLTDQALVKSRLRQHSNIHESYEDPCQRMVNAIQPESYIPPHRHLSVPKNELMVALRGNMALVVFDDCGDVTQILRLGNDCAGGETAVGIELDPDVWHTLIALESGCILLEVKAGPFDPNQPKDLASWAPEEASPAAAEYLEKLRALIE